jgi:di/tricarboxylate transporter
MIIPAMLFPVVIGISKQLGIDSRPLLLAILAGTMSDYLTPIGSTKGTISLDLANYTFGEYLRVGLPLVVINTIILMFWLPIYF